MIVAAAISPRDGKERLRRLTHDVRLKMRRESQEIKALRESRRAELVECASNIFEWLKELAKSPSGRKILSLLGEVVIFRDHYWECKPKEEKEYEAWLTYDRNSVLRYREFRRIGSLPSKVLTNPVQMVNELHPNYILSALDAIARGEVWKGIEYAIKWREEIFDIRRQRGWWPPQET